MVKMVFLNFIKNFEKLLKNEDLDIKNIIYQKAINNQIFDICKDLKKLLKGKESSKMETNIDSLDFQDNRSVSGDDNNNFNDNIKLRKNSIEIFDDIKSRPPKEMDMSINPIPKVEEKIDEEDSFIEGSMVKKHKSKFKPNNNVKYDLENALNNGLNLNYEENNKLKTFRKYTTQVLYQKEYIINFPDFEKDTHTLDLFGKHKSNLIDEKNKIDLRAQYYLFIVYLLEDISKDDTMKKKIIEEIEKIYDVSINIDKLVLKLYKLAFDHSGKKHRDFPYFNFYEFLNGLSLDDLKKLEDNIDKFQLELYDIYNFTIKEKTKINEKKNSKKALKDFNMTPTLSARSISIGNFENKKEVSNSKCSLISSGRRESLDIHFNRNNDCSSIKSLMKEEKKDIKKKNEEDSSVFKLSTEYIINESSEFDPLCEPRSTHILRELCSLILECLPTKDDIKNKSINEILEETHIKLNSQTFTELIGELRLIDLQQLTGCGSKICFWLNCFNFLLLFTIFYKKWNLSGAKTWKNFLNNVKYNIGGNLFSFNDIQYIIFNNIYLLPSYYKPSQAVKQNLITNKQKFENLTPFSLYIPTKEFLKPIIYVEDRIDNDLLKRKIIYLHNFIKIENKKIKVTELLLSYEPNFFKNEVFDKYKYIISKNISEFILNKKYSDISTISLKWEMNFDFLYEEIIISKDV